MFFIVALLFNLLIDIRVIKTNAPLKFEKVFFIIALCFLIFESGLLITNIVTSSIAYSEEYEQQTTARYLNFEDSSISFYNSGESYQLEVVFQSKQDVTNSSTLPQMKRSQPLMKTVWSPQG